VRTLWEQPGEWLKGATHVHSTESDGKRTPQQVVDAYKGCGYDFVVFTDHGRLTTGEGVDSHGLVLMPGVEIGAGSTEFSAHYHIVALGLTEPVWEQVDRESAQAVVDACREAGAVVFIAHPYWTLVCPQDLLGLKGYHGIEVFNAGCEWETRHGEASQHWDWLLARDRRVWGFAVDDAHWNFADYCGGWVMVRSEQRTPEAILSALRDGRFYASAGPLIEDLRSDGESLLLRTDEPTTARIIMPRPGRGWTSFQNCRDADCDPMATEHVMPLPPPGELFRLEVVRADGRKAWTNPMTVGDPDA